MPRIRPPRQPQLPAGVTSDHMAYIEKGQTEARGYQQMMDAMADQAVDQAIIEQLTALAPDMKAQIEDAARAAGSRLPSVIKTSDGFQNAATGQGVSYGPYAAPNMASQAKMARNQITNIQMLLQNAYRGEWLYQIGTNARADDVTRKGVSVLGEMEPVDIAALQKEARRVRYWSRRNEARRWGRLYGGAAMIVMIRDEDPSTPLDIEKVAAGSLEGFLVLDRWYLTPDMGDLVTDFDDPDLWLPRFYRVNPMAPAMPGMKIHHSRVSRCLGNRVPRWEQITDMMWSESVLEPVYAAVQRYLSICTGVANSVLRSYLRTLTVENLRDVLGGDPVQKQKLFEQLRWTAKTQTNDGLTLVDSRDKFEAHSYAFGGMNEIQEGARTEICGAFRTPASRLFGEDPGGFSDGGSMLELYYEDVEREFYLEDYDDVVLHYRIMLRSAGVEEPDDFDVKFNSLKHVSEDLQSQIFSRDVDSLVKLKDAGIFSVQQVLKELKQLSGVTGRATNITREDIEVAEDEIPDVMEGDEPLPGEEDLTKDPDGETNDEDTAPTYPQISPPRRAVSIVDGRIVAPEIPPISRRMAFRGRTLAIETDAGEIRFGTGWAVKLTCPYGYVEGTGSAEGPDEGQDVFVGPNPDSDLALVLDTQNPDSEEFDEHKSFVGFDTVDDAIACFKDSYHDFGHRRIGGQVEMSVDEWLTWLDQGDMTKPLVMAGSREADVIMAVAEPGDETNDDDWTEIEDPNDGDEAEESAGEAEGQAAE